MFATFRPAALSAFSALSLLFGGSALLAPTAAGAAPPVGAATHPTVLLKTSQGPITLELFPEKAPKTVANFLDYVNHGQYAGTVFHRVIPGFMIQGGGYDASLREKPTRAPIPLEARAGLSNVVGAVSMARTGDPDSATAQFFINTADNRNLDYPRPDGNGYAVFGRVTAGMDVVRKIEGVATGSSDGMSDVPRTPIVIESATVVKQ
ncbi:MAG: peptidylprolyl isomerase [Janthinobacterium lividum]